MLSGSSLQAIEIALHLNLHKQYKIFDDCFSSLVDSIFLEGVKTKIYVLRKKN